MKEQNINICIKEHIYRYEVNNVLIFFSLQDGLLIKINEDGDPLQDSFDVRNILNEIIKLELNEKINNI